MVLQIQKYHLFPSMRLTICLLCLIGNSINVSVFSTIHFAWVCMVNDTSHPNLTQDHHGATLLNWNKQNQRHIFAGYLIGGLIAMFLSGPLVHKFGAKLVFAAGMLLQSVAVVLVPVSSHLSYIVVMILRILTGVGGAVLFPVAYESCAHWAAKVELGTLLALALGGIQVGGAISQMFDGIECKHLPWPYIFYLAAIALVVFLAVWMVFYNNDPDESRWISEDEKLFILVKRNRTEQKKVSIPYRSIFKSTAVWSICIASSSAGYIGFLAAFMPTYFKEVIHADVQTNGIFSALPYLAMLCGRWLSGPLSDKKFGFKSHEPVLKIFNTVALVGSSLGLLGLTFVTESSPRYLPVTLLFFMYFAMALVTGGLFKSPLYIAPQFSGFIGSMHMGVNYGTAIFLPYIVSAMTAGGTAAEWHNVFYTCMALCAFGAVAFLIFGKGDLQPWARDTSMSYKKPSEVSMISTATLEKDYS